MRSPAHDRIAGIMKAVSAARVQPPPPPRAQLSLGITGHREDNAAFIANRERIQSVLNEILDALARAVAIEALAIAPVQTAPVRMHSILADGADQMAAEAALARGWELVVPLPFGRALNLAINARPEGMEETSALLLGQGEVSVSTRMRARAISKLCDQARCLELTDQDEAVSKLLLAAVAAPHNVACAQELSAASSERVALAGKVVLEQSDFVIGIWDGITQVYIGGTGHTIATALELGTAVIWIDAQAPEAWRVLRSPESLATLQVSTTDSDERWRVLASLVRDILRPDGGSTDAKWLRDPMAGVKALGSERWQPRSQPLAHGYRRIEALFGASSLGGRLANLRQTYAHPDASAADTPDDAVLRRFAWADGISARLSDTYRGGMIANFLLSPVAICGGVAYLPFGSENSKWMFELFELLLLSTILAITFAGRLHRWHQRWLDTRRVAEYLRQAPILLALGAARPPGRWPRGTRTSWPEWYARMALREIGLPAVAITRPYLREILDLLDEHVVQQRDYHRAKSRRLARAHHNLDRLSGILFFSAVIVVAGYLALEAASTLGLTPRDVPHLVSRVATFLSVMLPTFGGALAGVRYVGDFERFSAISEASAEKLDAVHERIDVLRAAPEEALDYGRVTELARVADDIVVSEIENWQAVFGGKHISVPA